MPGKTERELYDQEVKLLRMLSEFDVLEKSQVLLYASKMLKKKKATQVGDSAEEGL